MAVLNMLNNQESLWTELSELIDSMHEYVLGKKRTRIVHISRDQGDCLENRKSYT